MFHGWDGQLPETILEWLQPRASYYRVDHWASQNSPWRNFLSIVEQWVKELDEPLKTGGVPSFLIPAFFLKAAGGEWTPDLGWWSVLLSADGTQHTLVTRLHPLP